MKKLISYLYNKTSFFLLVGFLIYLHSYFFLKPFTFGGDTVSMFEIYHFFYGEFFFNNHIAQWLPNHALGIPASLVQLWGLSPSSYLTILLGKLFHLTNALLMFK